MMTELERLACCVAIVTPTNPAFYQIQVSVPLDLITDIRAEMTKRGFDWREARRQMDAKIKGAKA